MRYLDLPSRMGHIFSQLSSTYLRLRAVYFDFRPQRNRKEPTTVLSINRKLETLGFTEQAFNDLQSLTQSSRLGLTTGFACWRLALWIVRSSSSLLTSADLYLLLLKGLACPLPREIHFQLRLLQLLYCANKSEIKSVPQAALQLTKRYRTRATDFLFAVLLHQINDQQKLNTLGLIYRGNDLAEPQLLPATEGQTTLLDRLHCPNYEEHEQPAIDCDPLVSVIIACFNSESTIETALRSLEHQSWKNIEVIIVDDNSEDSTIAIVTKYLSDRVRLVQMPVNSGAYAARNAGLAECKGDFITLHDADDWSHPAKIKKQAEFLQSNPDIAACTTRRVRISDNLDQVRLSSRGWILGLNTSSLMIRRELLIKVFRGWDDVRFAADTELLKRIQARLGKGSIKHLLTGPLTLQRLSSDSASSMSKTGYPGYTFGIRHIYAKSYEYAHRHRLPPFPAAPSESNRAFPAPKLMNRSKERGCHYSVILASEFRMKGGSTRSCIEELKVQHNHQVSTAVLPMYRYDLNPAISEVDMLYTHNDPASIQFLAYGEEASCELFIIRYPPVLRYYQRYLPQIKADNVVVIVNQPPFSDYGPTGVKRYDLPAANSNLVDWLGVEPLWYPIGPLVREALHRHHSNDLPAIRLADSDWSNIIDLSTWQLRNNAPCLSQPGSPIRVGRHSRDESLKWIEDLEGFRLVYPPSWDFEICVLGGAKSVARRLGGKLPGNWTVHAFGSLDPREFLATLDFFVYYTHSSWVESFGRVIIEAMAIGVPVILPFSFQQLFADAAIYAEPNDVQSLMHSLIADPEAYWQHVRKARRYVEHHFGHDAHLRRLESYGIQIVR